VLTTLTAGTSTERAREGGRSWPGPPAPPSPGVPWVSPP